MKTNLFAILAAGLVLAACNNDNEPAADNADGVAAVLITNLEGRVQTRMADTEWSTDTQDAIGIFSLNDEMDGVTIDGVEQSNMAVNVKYDYAGEDGDGKALWTSERAFRFKNPNSTRVDFYAYYPYTEAFTASSDEGQSISFSAVEDDQNRKKVQTAAGQARYDYLFAGKESAAPDADIPHGSKDVPQVKFQFAHCMSKIVIEMTPDPKSVGTLGTLRPTLHGLRVDAVFSMKRNDGDGTTPAVPEAKVSLADDAKVVDFELQNLKETGIDARAKQTFVAIVPPQAIGSSGRVYLTILSPNATGEDTYLTADLLAGKTLKAGNSYTVKITVKKKELVVESSEISDWNPNENAGSSDAVLQ